jgi:hypothetical protein
MRTRRIVGSVGVGGDGLVKEGVLQQWEVGDPDEYVDEHASSPVPWTGRDLIHKEPTTDVAHHFTL